MSSSLFLLARPLMAEITLALGAIFLLMLSLGKIHAQNIARLAILILLTSAIMLVYMPYDGEFSMNFAKYFSDNAYIKLAKVLVLVFASMICSLVTNIAVKNKEFSIIILFAVLGMLLMLGSNDFLTLYMSLELQSLCLYVLASFDNQQIKSTEAGVKYFILSAISSGLMLYGISLIYGFGGTTNFTEINEVIHYANYLNLGLLVGMILLLIGFCFKLAAAPFHMWSPDVYEGAPSVVTAFFAVVPKIAALLVLLRLLFTAFAAWVLQWQQIILFIGVLSMFVGAFGAIKQNNIKRLLAYSAISHVGYMMLGIASNSINGASAVIHYIIIYAVLNVGVFACILLHGSDEINSYAGVGKTKPFYAFCMASLLFSLAGIPPFAGFFAKFSLLFAAMDSNMIVPCVLGVLASVISCYYCLRLIKIMYFDEVVLEMTKSNTNILPIVIFSALFNICYILFSDYMEIFIKNAALSIFI
jgi:NADH-quinone oxidoreductase subunit N